MAVVIDFDGRIDAAADRNFFHFAIGAGYLEGELLRGTEFFVEADDVEDFGAGEVQSLGAHAFVELQREHAHADEV